MASRQPAGANRTRDLGAFVAETSIDDIPTEVRAAGVRYMTDAIGCAFAGIRTAEALEATAVARAMGGVSEASILNQMERVPAAHAAFANTLAGRADLYDDSYGVGHIHAGAALTFSALAMTERTDGTGRDALRAFLLGGEVSCRVSRAVGEGHYLAGFHNSGTVVVFGTAGVAAVALGCDVDGAQRAISLAGEQAAGVRQYQIDGAPANSALHAANAAKNGIWSALLAHQGFPAAATMLDGEHGFLQAFAPAGNANELTDDLGLTWRIAQTGIKAFPGCRGTHAAAAAIDDFLVEDHLTPHEVVSIQIFQKPLEVDLCDRPFPKTDLDAHFSIQYAVGRVLVHQSLNPWEYAKEYREDPEVAKVQARVRIHADKALEAYPDAAARVEVTLANGEVLQRFVASPRGEPKNPLSAAQLRHKFISASSATISRERAEAILELCARIDSEALPARALGDLLRAG